MYVRHRCLQLDLRERLPGEYSTCTVWLNISCTCSRHGWLNIYSIYMYMYMYMHTTGVNLPFMNRRESQTRVHSCTCTVSKNIYWFTFIRT